ncbi:MAG: hypothetical protein QW728_06570 [Thermoplasmata archaeon]
MDSFLLRIVLLLLAMIFAGGLFVIFLVSMKIREIDKSIESLETRLERIRRIQYIDRLRRTDFDAFVEEINKERAKKKLDPVSKDVLKKIRYNLMYTIDDAI